MAKSKLIVSDPGTGKSIMYELSDDQSKIFRGMVIGHEFDGTTVGVEGTIKITGGSDSAGFPMRSDVMGGVKKYVLLTKSVGFRTKEKGLKKRKLVRGNTITADIYQINAVLVGKPKTKAVSSEKKKEPAPEAKAVSSEKKKEPAPEAKAVSSENKESAQEKGPG